MIRTSVNEDFIAVQQYKSMNNQFFIFGPQCENNERFGLFGAGGGGGGSFN